MANSGPSAYDQAMTRLIALLLLLMSAAPAAPSSADCVVLLHGLARSEASLLAMQAALSGQRYLVINQGYPSTTAPPGSMSGRRGRNAARRG